MFPHPPYAEDQPLAHLILTTHVLHRGFQLGTGIGLLVGTARALFFSSRSSSSLPKPVTARSTPTNTKLVTRLTQVLRPSALGGLGGLALFSLLLPVHMWGKEIIEWQDRSWRLLENRGQVVVDWWSVGGMVLGVGVVALGLGARGRNLGKRERALRVLGGAGVGSLGGVLGLMGWRVLSGSKR
ncbi:uncharacterized protein BO80DRAFT_463068 [Aspergillus ibericus CBS 121593]|uniref:Uncharacterized protein n=1 Tax=Aspergillus ibericus CBS 121593 TaxID=1448316 RepID=A0A395H6M0_9EURO|nr:hypothetical protein BO80DRAFT_463068 [Aspergillus ibericus CBS 121593]RAL02815.1 hypothetical protein BO80DRAFT_463068 [Aspergillus ibericus CBS 121593]